MVARQKPQLGFDLMFHSGYEVSIPVQELEGSGNTLSVFFRVTPVGQPGEPVFFGQRIRVPAINPEMRGQVWLPGRFDLGEGSYHVDWLIHDAIDRFCSASWDLEASLPPKDKNIGLALLPGAIQSAEHDQFLEEPPVRRATNESLNVKVLVNFAAQNPNSAALEPVDTVALISILRNISRNPHIRKITLTAFNLQEQRVVFRQENADRIDFPALGEALKSLSLGTVGVDQLLRKHGDTEFLTELVKDETGTASRPDALIFAGPKTLLDANVPQDELKQIGSLEYPVFYMHYDRNPQAVPWTDSISRMVKFFRGYDFNIRRPSDLWNAVTDMVSRTTAFRSSKR